MSDKCPVCNSVAKEDTKSQQYKDSFISFFSCERCGDYWVESRLKSFLPRLLEKNDRKISVLSHWIRTRHEAILPEERKYKKMIIIDEELADNIIKNQTPNPAEQVNNLIRWLGENAKGYGEFLDLEEAKDLSLIGSATPKEFRWIIHHLINSKYIEGNITSRSMNGRLSFDGWQYYEELKRGAIDSRKAFMAMEYGDEQLDKIVDEVFKPAVKQTGFDLFRLVDRPQPAGLIDDRLRVEIQTSRFLIADLTHENGGAYWEAGFAEGLGKPVIYTCEKKKFKKLKTHFDTNHHLTITWDDKNLKEAAEKLKATIRATLPSEAKLTDE